MNTWEKLRHDNIVVLEGYILGDGFPAIVSTWAAGRTIVEYVKAHPGCDELAIVSVLSSSLEQRFILSVRCSEWPTAWDTFTPKKSFTRT